MKKNNIEEGGTNRRKFLKLGLMTSFTAITGASIITNLASSKEEGKRSSGEVIRLLTPEGKIVQVNASNINKYPKALITPEESRKGIPNRKFVMVIDLAKCKNALKCTEACNKGHHIMGQNSWLKVYKMQNTKKTSPYWQPTLCQHCDQPACVTVCPVGATFKRKDGIVLIDNERCIGCRFCMAACPYSVRIFNWSKPNQPKLEDGYVYTPDHAGKPSLIGTVDKCDFCPHEIKKGRLPHCVAACPEGVFYFGDLFEDTVTNGEETLKFSHLIKDKSGYRLLESLGTSPSVYYLPPVNRLVEFEDSDYSFEQVQYTSLPKTE